MNLCGATLFWRKFSVLTFDEAGLKRVAEKLYTLASQDFNPNLLIGIRTGGYHLALPMKAFDPTVELLPITCRRPASTTKYKFGIIKKMLTRLPRGLTNFMRIIELLIMAEWRTPKKTEFIPDAQELDSIASALKRLGPNAKILIIDDSIDSGATIANVRESISRIADADATIRIAVVSVTTTRPLMQPDYVLYRHALCRFPWSLDF